MRLPRSIRKAFVAARGGGEHILLGTWAQAGWMAARLAHGKAQEQAIGSRSLGAPGSSHPWRQQTRGQLP